MWNMIKNNRSSWSILIPQFTQDFPSFNTDIPGIISPQSWANWDSWSPCDTSAYSDSLVWDEAQKSASLSSTPR